MTASLARFIGFLVVVSALLACASTHGMEPRYAEYSLDPSAHPESVECFYECLRSSREEFRDACFSRCDGVVATTTTAPCLTSSPTLCRSYAVEEEAPADDESDGDAALSIIGGLLELGAEAADDHCEQHHERSAPPSPAEKRSASSPKTRWGTRSSSQVTTAPKSVFGSRVEKKR